MPFKDPEKKNAYRRKWYSLNSESEKNHVARRKRQLRKWLEDYKRNIKCTICGENHPATLDFHHKSDKKFIISFMIANGYSIQKIEEEITKCEVLCSNCHRKLHYSNKKL